MVILLEPLEVILNACASFKFPLREMLHHTCVWLLLLCFIYPVYKGDVYDIMDRYRAETGSTTDCSLLVLVPVRLGGESLNIVYFPCLKVGSVALAYCLILVLVLLCTASAGQEFFAQVVASYDNCLLAWKETWNVLVVSLGGGGGGIMGYMF